MTASDVWSKSLFALETSASASTTGALLAKRAKVDARRPNLQGNRVKEYVTNG
jgi:hypothetical protein